MKSRKSFIPPGMSPGTSKAAPPFKARRRGFVIIELMVALVLSGFVMLMLFISWRYISNYTITQQRKSMFQTEADRIAQTIVRQIRQSPEVVKTAPNSIVFLSQSGLDTITYEFVYGTFQKNNFALWDDDNRARITEFSIEKENAGLGTDTSNSITILLTVGLQDKFGNSSVIPLKVRAAISPERFNTEAGGARGWNF